MIIVMHVLIALASMVATGVAYIAPSRARLRASYTLFGLTLATGTFLVVATKAPMLSSCTTGLIYTAVVGAGMLAARLKLSANADQS